MSTETDGPAAFHVSADLPGLAGVPAEVGPVRCLGCGERTATVYHERHGDNSEGGDIAATLVCRDCGSVFDIRSAGRALRCLPDGPAVGVLVDAARRGDPRVASGSAAEDVCPDCGRAECTGEDCYWPDAAGLRGQDDRA